MLHIGICDDIPQHATNFKKKLESGNYTSQKLTIYLFHSAKELLEFSQPKEGPYTESQEQALDLLFLDVDMPEMSGLELLNRHKPLFQNTKVILLTAHDGYAVNGYQYGVYRFLWKEDLSDSAIFEIFNSFEKENILNQPLELFSHGRNISVLLKDILYIESEGSYCNVTTTSHTWHCFMRLKDIVPLLPKEYFYQTHKSYVVNMNYINKVKDKECYIVMTDGGRVDISHRKKKEFDEIHTRFLLRQ